MSLTFVRPSQSRSTQYRADSTIDYQTPWADNIPLTTERWTDTRSPLVKTPAGPWRPPTYWKRVVETGDLYWIGLDTAKIAARRRYNGEISERELRFGINNSTNPYDAIPAFPQGLIDQAVIKSRLKLKDTSINLGQAFGERAQTANLVSDSIRRVVGAVRAVRRGDLRKAKKVLDIQFMRRKVISKEPFSMWLELQYGWKPLLMDVYGATTALSDREMRASRGKATIKSRSSRKSALDRADFNIPGNNAYLWLNKHREIKHECWIRTDWVQSNDGWRSAKELGLTNPLEVAWELVPFSFVADWFVPVGDFISQLDATLGWSFLGGTIGKKTTVWNTYSFSHATSKDYRYDVAWASVTGMSGKGRQMRYERSVLSSMPFPRLPDFSKLEKASYGHVANGIALLSSLFLGGRRIR